MAVIILDYREPCSRCQNLFQGTYMMVVVVMMQGVVTVVTVMMSYEVRVILVVVASDGVMVAWVMPIAMITVTG